MIPEYLSAFLSVARASQRAVGAVGLHQGLARQAHQPCQALSCYAHDAVTSGSAPRFCGGPLTTLIVIGARERDGQAHIQLNCLLVSFPLQPFYRGMV